MPPHLLEISRAVELHLEHLDRQASDKGNLDQCGEWVATGNHFTGSGSQVFCSFSPGKAAVPVALADFRDLSDTYFRRAACLRADLVGRLPPTVRDVNVCLGFQQSLQRFAVTTSRSEDERCAPLHKLKVVTYVPIPQAIQEMSNASFGAEVEVRPRIEIESFS